MSITTMLKEQWHHFRAAANRVWSWHHAQMQASGRYARAVIQGVVKAMWQPTVGRYIAVLATVLIEVVRILCEDGFAADNIAFD